ncbi:MAG: PQQ-binding-like beta-propeller repeat protein [Phycisphaerales bacterium]|nr:MAG: PQQ-binding-like beta-propeller repeat protein [Phycisphaerales bacterium]
MGRLHGALAAAVGIAAISGGRAAADSLVDAGQLRAAGYTKYWETQLPLRRGDQVAAVHLLDDNIYVTTTDGEVLAVHPGAGLLRWGRHITQRTYTIFRPTHVVDEADAGPVVFTTSSGITVIDRYSGELRKVTPSMFAAGSAATGEVTRLIEGDSEILQYRLFAGSSDGHLYAVEWKVPAQPEPTRLWRARTGGAVRSTPVYGDADHLYCASMGGRVYCCTSATKAEQWTFPPKGTIGPVRGDIHVTQDGVYVASADRSVYKLDPISGIQRWRRRLPEMLETGPVVLAGTVFQYCPGAGVFAIDAGYGDILWDLPEGQQAVARHGERICITMTDNHLAWVDVKTGKVNSKVSLPDRTLAAQNHDDAAIYLISPLGNLMCARPVGVKPLTNVELEVAHATLNQPPPKGDSAPETAESPPEPDDDASTRPPAEDEEQQ